MTPVDPPDWKVTPMDAIDAEETARVVKRIQDLPDLTRQVVTLRKTYGYTQDEIAKRLKITPEQVMQEIGKAVRAFADMGEIDDN
jgi:RNA polymerase sigma factor (sigma-70 family)